MGINKSLLKALDEHREKIEGPHFLFSVDKPKFPEKQIHKENREQTIAKLKSNGYDAHPVQGKYGEHEDSIVVYGVNPHQAEKLHGIASKFGQDSSIYSNGKKHELRYHHGENAGLSAYGQGTVHHDKEPTDNFTKLPSGHHFTHAINFDNLKPSGKLEKSDIKMPRKEFIEEHKHLVNVLKHPNPKNIEAEKEKQSKELQEELDKSEDSNEDSKIKLIHYSNRPGLTHIEPKFKGSGVDSYTKGRESEHPQSFFYRLHTKPEDVVLNNSKHSYVTSMDSKAQPIYDIGTDPKGLAASAIKENNGVVNMDLIHSKLKEAGYHGYHNSAHPDLSNVVVSYHPLKVETTGPATLPGSIKKSEDPKAYAKLASEGVMVGFPVKIGNQTHRPDNGIAYHATVQFFPKDKKNHEEIHSFASKLDLNPPKSEETGIKLGQLKDRLGNDIYTVHLHGPHADRIKQCHDQFKHLGHSEKYDYSPHISVDKATWDKISQSGAKTAKEAGIEFSPAEFRVGPKTLASYGGDIKKNENPHTPKDSEDFSPTDPVKYHLKREKYHQWHANNYRNASEEAKKTVHELHVEQHSFPKSGKDYEAMKRQHLKHAGNLTAQAKEHEYLAAWHKEKAQKAESSVQDHTQILAASEQYDGLESLFKAELEKGTLDRWGTMLGLGAALAGSPAKSSSILSEQAKHPDYHSNPITVDHNFKNRILASISTVESSGGKNTHHKIMPDGRQAYGHYGLMPDTIKDTIKAHPDLRDKYRKALSLGQASLHRFMHDNPNLEHIIANRHVDRLIHHFGHDVNKIGMSWLNGITGTYKAIKKGVNPAKHWHAIKVKEAFDSQSNSAPQKMAQASIRKLP